MKGLLARVLVETRARPEPVCPTVGAGAVTLASTRKIYRVENEKKSSISSLRCGMELRLWDCCFVAGAGRMRNNLAAKMRPCAEPHRRRRTMSPQNAERLKATDCPSPPCPSKRTKKSLSLFISDNDCSRPFQSTYYDERMRAQPALLRARAPYLIKNTITGFVICSLVIGICECYTTLLDSLLTPSRHLYHQRHLSGRI